MSRIIRQARKDDTWHYSAIVPTWNNLLYVQCLVRSIERHSSLPHQLIFYVNEGSDGTVDWLMNHTSADIIHSSKNVGVCVALNEARHVMKTEWLVFLNDDMYVLPNWDTYLLEEVKKAGHRRLFYSATLMQPGEFWDNSVIAQCNYGHSPLDFDEKSLLRDFNQFSHPDWCGSTWPPNIVHSTVWDAVGGYDEAFSPGMYSDPDFAMKLWQSGLREFKGIGRSRVYHFSSVSTNRIVHNKGQRRFLKKWGITNRTFGKHYLRRGTPYNGPLPEVKRTLSYYIDVVRSKIKMFWI